MYKIFIKNRCADGIKPATIIMKKYFFIFALAVAIALPCFAGWYTCKRCNGSGYENYTRTCNYCNGKGVRERIVDCSRCGGRGEVRDSYGDWVKCSACDGAKKVFDSQTCTGCRGTGELKDPCRACGGRGKVQIDD